MTNQEKKERLSRYRAAGEEARRLEDELIQWEAAAASAAGRCGKGPGDRLREALEQIAGLRDELSAELTRQVALRREIEAAVESLGDQRLRQLLRYRYIQGWTWEKIAEETYTDPRWLHRLHARALDQLTMESHPRAVVR